MYREEYLRWKNTNLEDADLNPELERIADDDDAIKDRFAVSLKFGTAECLGGTSGNSGPCKLGKGSGRKPNGSHQL